MGDRRAQDRAVQHPREHDVVDIVALAAHEPRVLLALEPTVADGAVLVARSRVVLVFFDDGHASTSSGASAGCAGCSAAHCTERTMVAYPVQRQI